MQLKNFTYLLIVMLGVLQPTLRKIPKFQLIFCFGNFAEKQHSFRKFSGESSETAFPQNFHTRKLGEILLFYSVPVM